jgi:hypothetical protein
MIKGLLEKSWGVFDFAPSGLDIVAGLSLYRRASLCAIDCRPFRAQGMLRTQSPQRTLRKRYSPNSLLILECRGLIAKLRRSDTTSTG